ncbi:MAG: tyrosine-type recombinase/integrase [Gammaproteobacteria bacterium]|nr:tyrosine-type recombinase/integrase [Gammaproteobacteria bacterium]
MGRKRTPGLYKRNGTWHIDKQIFGHRLRASTGSSELFEAERFLARRIEELRQATIYGVRPKRIFREATVRYLKEHQHKASIDSDAGRIRSLDKYIGNKSLDTIHMGVMQPYIEARRKDGIKTRTINHGLKIVRRILNLAANEWLDEHGLSWLHHAPKIKLLPEPDLRKPYPLNWVEQKRFFAELPLHLRQMALFAVNTGCRDAEICNLRWEWEEEVLELGISVFIIPSEMVKNRSDRLVVLNKEARAVIEKTRGQHPVYVFTFRGRPIKRILNSGWKKAREVTGINVRVHDLKHTFGRRLRSAGVSFEDRQDLLGHRSSSITTHYSGAELTKIIAAANKVCVENSEAPALVLLKGSSSSRKIPTRGFGELKNKAVSY